MALKTKMLLAGACVAAALNFNAFADSKYTKNEPIPFTQNGKTYNCTPVQPFENDTPRKKGECMEKVFQLENKGVLRGFDILKDFDNVLYFHDFGEKSYAVFTSDKIWLVWLGEEKNYEKPDEPRELGAFYLKRSVDYNQETCSPKKSDEKIKEIYSISDTMVLATTTENRIFKVEKTDESISCVLTKLVKKEDYNICVYRESDGTSHFAFYGPISEEDE